MSTNKDMLDALERAGVSRELVSHPIPGGSFRVEREDLDRELVFEEEMYYFERGPRFRWRWDIWERWSPDHNQRWAFREGSRERDVAGMVARVVDFLGEET